MGAYENELMSANIMLELWYLIRDCGYNLTFMKLVKDLMVCLGLKKPEKGVKI